MNLNNGVDALVSMLTIVQWRSRLLVVLSAVGIITMIPAAPAVSVSADSASSPQPGVRSETSGDRSGYAAVALSTLKGSLASGDPNQLPLMVVRSSMGNPDRPPTVEFDRTNPTQIVAWVTYKGLEDDSVKGIRYRIEMVPSDSLCACQSWKVSWVGQQYQCQAGRGSQDWSPQLCR